MMRQSNVSRSRPRVRRGFTLPELMVAMVMLAIISAALMSMLSKQQRFYRGTGDIMDLRSQLRQASQSITADLRGVSSVGGDILTMTDSSIDFRQTIGGSIICKIPTPGGTTLIIPPQTLASGAVFTTWLSTPIQGDSILIFDEGATTANADDSWQKFALAANPLAALNLCPTGSGNFTQTGDATQNSYTITLSGNLDTKVTVGAPVRFYHYAHYSLYKASDNKWYLGFCTPACSVSNPITAVAGPFRAYTSSTSPDTSGLRLTYYDSTGVVTANVAKVARIGIIIRGATQNPVNVSGFKNATMYDSLSTMIAVRNRS